MDTAYLQVINSLFLIAAVNKMIKEMIPNVRVSNDARELILNCCTGDYKILFWPTWVNINFDDGINSLTPNISWIILLTVCHTIYVMLVWRIWNLINQ